VKVRQTNFLQLSYVSDVSLIALGGVGSVFSPSGSRVLDVAESVAHRTGIRVADPDLKCWRGEIRRGTDARRKDAKNRAEVAIEVAIEVNCMHRRK
jgi:hypothetical protein